MSEFFTKLKISKNLKILKESKFSEANERLRYNVAQTLQISPDKAILFIGMELVGGAALDYCAGVDGIIFDDINSISETSAFPILRNHIQINPLNGEKCMMMKFPMVGGFVPLGAKNSAGDPHPCAGTGFGLSFTHSISCDLDAKSGFSGVWAGGKDVYRAWELLQFKYDGKSFEIVSKKILGAKDMLPNFTFINQGFNCAIADGDDLISTVQGDYSDIDESNMSGFAEIPSGIMRWKYGENGWNPVKYTNVTGDITAFECSLIRDVDSSLLFTARETGKAKLEKFDVFVWKSIDNGDTWKLLFHLPKIRAASPVTINMLPQGIPFIAGNLLTGTFDPNPRGGGFGYKREILCLWELKKDRTGLKSPLVFRFARIDFGLPPTPHGWRIDHAVSNMVKLADGKWRALLSYRVMATAETNSTLPPTPFTGCYIEEVQAYGKQKIAPWQF